MHRVCTKQYQGTSGVAAAQVHCEFGTTSSAQSGAAQQTTLNTQNTRRRGTVDGLLFMVVSPWAWLCGFSGAGARLFNELEHFQRALRGVVIWKFVHQACVQRICLV